MKNSVLYVCLIVWCLGFLNSHAQNRQSKFNVADMHEKKWEYMMSEVNLSPIEKNAVKPLFLDYENSVWNLHKDLRNMLRKAKNSQLSSKDYSTLNDKIINQDIKRSQLLREYHLKLRKLLTPETLFNYYKAEKNFERQLLSRRPAGPPPAKNE